MNDNGFIPFGLHAPAPDLLKALPGLARLQSSAPQYIARAESAQRLARRFAREEILPRAPGIDAACTKDPAYFDWELWRRANRLKLNIAPVPKEMGGLGWTALANALAVEEFTSACMGCASNITFNTFGLLGALVEFRADIVLKIIHQMVTAQRLEKPLFWSWAITEPSAGTDVEDGEAMATMQPSTEAERVEGGFRINGTKCFITNGSLADYVIATIPADTARPRESMATFLIPATSKGFSVGRIERKCGQKASQTAELFFQNVFVPDENVWEPPGRGLRHTREILSITRGFIGIAGMGMARGALERGINYAAYKKTGGRRLIDEKWIQMALADMIQDINSVRCAGANFAMALDACHVWKLFDLLPVKAGLKIIPKRLLLSQFLRSSAASDALRTAGSRLKHRLVPDDTIEDFVSYGSMLKVAGTDLAVSVAARVADIVGLEGMDRRHGIEKSFRDAKVSQIYEGTNQANRMDIFNHSFRELFSKK